MTIEVAPGVLSRMLENRSVIVLQVRGCGSYQAAAEALERSRADFARLTDDGERRPVEGMALVTVPPAGPFIWLDARHASDKEIRTFPDVVARYLADAGVDDALITCPESGGPIGLPRGLLGTPKAVVLYLYRDPPPLASQERAELPPAWLNAAHEWVKGDLDDDHVIWAKASILEFPVTVGSTPRLLEQVKRSRTNVYLVTGHPSTPKVPEPWPPKGWDDDQLFTYYGAALGDRVRAANVHTFRVPYLALASGGAGASDDDLLATFSRFTALARELASEAAYAFVSIEPGFQGFCTTPITEWSQIGGQSADNIAWACDEAIFDAYPYQVLGPGHLARLGHPPARSTELGNGRIEVRIGAPADWLVDPPAQDNRNPWRGLSERRRTNGIQQRARQLLAPCLLTSQESGRYLARQKRAQR